MSDEPEPDPLANTGAEILDARPLGPSAERALRGERLAAMMFGVEQEPVRFGRFVLLERIGEGGMGTVHSAYDPQLDRRVALKLLHASDGSSPLARQRMLREAQALARLSHPNVVPVHDAGLLDEQVFIVMEYVRGMTLRQWIDACSPDWAERLAVYLDAGRGLAAAHDSGVVHRDFKPDNAIRGDDGRVRVLDFGLARGEALTTGEAPPGTAPSEGLDPLVAESTQRSSPGAHEGKNSSSSLNTLTITGAVLGTPAYMAPEQFLGVRAGPAADQYSFCVAMFEALYGHRPYSGSSLEELRANVLLAELEEPSSSKIPRWLFVALRQGLALSPQQRYASMNELLLALTADPRRRRRRALAVVLSFGFAVALGVGVGTLREGGEESCSGAELTIAEVWGEAQRERVADTIAATGQAYAEEVHPQVETKLDAYARGWVEMQRDACQAHLRGEQSDSIFDKRGVCLERRLDALDGAVEILSEGEGVSLAKAVELVEGLPKLTTCARLEVLEAEVPPPEDPARARAVEQQRARLTRAEARERAGDLPRAKQEASAVLDAAGELDYGPLSAEAQLVLGRVEALAGHADLAAVAFAQAARVGLAASVDRVAVEAIARGIYVEGTRSGDASGPLAQLPLAEGLATRIPDGAFVHALLLNNAGSVYMAQGQPESARALFSRANAVREAGGLEEVELASVLFNLAMLAPNASARAELSGRAHAQLEAALGPAHPLTLQARVGHSHQLSSLAAALEARAPACELYQRYHPQLGPLVGDCLYTLGLLFAEHDEPAAAREQFEAVADFIGPDDPAEAQRTLALARAYAALYRGSLEPALLGFESLLAGVQPTPEQWWVNRDIAYARVGEARALRELGREEAARASFAAALARFEQLGQLSADADLARTGATIRALLR